MAGLADLTRAEVEKYASNGLGANVKLFFMADDVRQSYAVLAIDYPKRKQEAMIVVMARVVGDTVVIDEDNTDKPLIDALLQQGVPRGQIVRLYAGEPWVEPEALAL
jgi:hypothetical protein